jgi:hypothetical protein
MEIFAIRGRTPPATLGRYPGVLCLNPTCGNPIDVLEAWPPINGYPSATVVREIVTLECPHCERRSTYCSKDVHHFLAPSHDCWR